MIRRTAPPLPALPSYGPYRGPEIKSSLKDAAATVGHQVKESGGRVLDEAKRTET